jgi:hypothetical protein
MPDYPLAGRVDDLAVGLAFGAAATVACLAARGRPGHRPDGLTTAGLALTAAGLAALAVTVGMSGRLAGGLLLLALAGAIPGPTVAMARPGRLAVYGALLLAGSTLVGSASVAVESSRLRPELVASVCLVAMTGVVLSDFDWRHRHSGLVLPMLAVSAAGIWTTVPDVEAGRARWLGTRPCPSAELARPPARDSWYGPSSRAAPAAPAPSSVALAPSGSFWSSPSHGGWTPAVVIRSTPSPNDPHRRGRCSPSISSWSPSQPGSSAVRRR